MKINNLAKVAVTAGLAFGLIAAGASAAQADPINPTPVPGTPASYGKYVATGSDTIQDLYNHFANVDLPSGKLASWDAFGSATVQVTDGGPVFNRPGGSGAGRQALTSSYDPADVTFPGPSNTRVHLLGTNAVDIARSSGQPSTANLITGGAVGGSDDNLTYVQLARDAVDVAVGQSVSGLGNLTTDQLQAIYSCGVTFTDSTVSINALAQQATITNSGSAPITVDIQLPQSNSGTRQFFMAALGLPNLPTPSCIDEGTSLLPTQENNATYVQNNGIIPFSAASFIAQWNNIAPDQTGGPNAGETVDSGLQVTTIDGRTAVTNDLLHAGKKRAFTTTDGNSLYGATTAPIGPQTAPVFNGIFARDVYSVVPTDLVKTGSASLDTDLRTLVEDTLPGLSTSISSYGFLPVNFTLSGTQTKQDLYLHSKWEVAP